MVELEGTVERITYYNEDNGFTVAKFVVKENDDVITAVGYFHSLEVGEVLKLKGCWTMHKDYGHQFKVDYYETVVPATASDIESYLASGLIRGIGPATAKKIVRMFGEKSLEVLANSPEELLKIPGIGEKKLEMIVDSFSQQQETREVIMFLQRYGIGPSVAVKIYKNYKDKSIQILKENPYRLADEVFGIGFKTADRIAQSMGMGLDSPERLCAGLKYTMYEASEEGHVFLPAQDLLNRASQLLNVEGELLRQALFALE